MNSEKHNILKKSLLGLILLFLWLVILQDLFQFKSVRHLTGYFTHPKDSTFSIKSWKKGNFQMGRENYLQYSFSFRPDYVRLQNTLKYKLFNKTHLKEFAIGKDRELFTNMQIESYLGIDSIPEEDIKRKTGYLKQLQDTLHKLGKELYVVIPPIKPEILPEKIPSKFLKKNKTNNYERYRRFLIKKGIFYIDIVEHFKELKKNGETNLFPHTGSHWNSYGAAKGMQYFLSEFNKLSKYKIGNIDIIDSSLEKERLADPDIYNTLNLFNKYPPDMTLSVNTKIIDTNTNKPRTIFISDSFFHLWGELGIRELFDSTTYDFYHHLIILKNKQKVEYIYPAEKLLNDFDVYIILCNESNLARIGWGFIEELYYHFYPEAPHRAYYDVKFREEVYAVMNDIKKDQTLYKLIEDKAFKRKINPTQQLYEDAVWILFNEQKK